MSDSSSELEGLREESKSTVDPVKSFLSGGFGGIACVLVGHPFDLTYVTGEPGAVKGVDVLTRQEGANADCFPRDIQWRY
jgi:solute carrier family 25 carnitine/acylcarnitine transporter 20/29